MNHLSIDRQTNDTLFVSSAKGSHIKHACREAIQLAKKEKTHVLLCFNGVSISITENDNEKKLTEQFYEIAPI